VNGAMNNNNPEGLLFLHNRFSPAFDRARDASLAALSGSCHEKKKGALSRRMERPNRPPAAAVAGSAALRDEPRLFVGKPAPWPDAALACPGNPRRGGEINWKG